MFRSRRVITAGTALALVLTSSGASQAADSRSSAEQIAQHIRAAVSKVELPAHGRPYDAPRREIRTTHRTALPQDPAHPLALETGQRSLPELSITLPHLRGAGQLVQSSDGTAVYKSDQSASLAVQTLADGSTRLLSVLENAAAPSSLRYTFNEAVPVLRDDGGADLVAKSRNPSVPLDTIIAQIDPAWAIDANGFEIATRYYVDGRSLVQEVSFDASTQFPVVADPRISFGWGAYLSLNKIEIRALATALGAAGSLSAYAACEVYAKRLSRVPGVGGLVKQLCRYVSATNVYKILRSLPSLSASYYTRSCYQARIPPQSPAWKVVASSQCVVRPFTWG